MVKADDTAIKGVDDLNGKKVCSVAGLDVGSKNVREQGAPGRLVDHVRRRTRCAPRPWPTAGWMAVTTDNIDPARPRRRRARRVQARRGTVHRRALRHRREEGRRRLPHVHQRPPRGDLRERRLGEAFEATARQGRPGDARAAAGRPLHEQTAPPAPHHHHAADRDRPDPPWTSSSTTSTSSPRARAPRCRSRCCRSRSRSSSACVVAACRVSPVPPLRVGGRLLRRDGAQHARCTVLFVLFFFGLTKVGHHRTAPFTTAVIVLGGYTGAFVAETVRAGHQHRRRGQAEAARSLGLTFPQVLGIVVLPQALAHRRRAARQPVHRPDQEHARSPRSISVHELTGTATDDLANDTAQ